MKKISRVPQKDNKLGLDVLVNAIYIALHLFGFVTKKWVKQMKEPSNSIPYSDERVTGLNKLQKRFYEVLATIKRDIPEPSP